MPVYAKQCDCEVCLSFPEVQKIENYHESSAVQNRYYDVKYMYDILNSMSVM